jgi:hypothetical protein
MYCLAGLSGCENLSRYDPPQEGNCPLDASADRTKLGMLKPTGRAMCPIIEHSEELDNVFHVLLNKVSYGIVCNALLMQKNRIFARRVGLPCCVSSQSERVAFTSSSRAKRSSISVRSSRALVQKCRAASGFFGLKE